MTDQGPDRSKKNRPYRQRVTCARCKRENVQLSYVSNESSFIRWENGERLRLHPDFKISTPALLGITYFFRPRKNLPPTPKSDGSLTPLGKATLDSGKLNLGIVSPGSWH